VSGSGVQAWIFSKAVEKSVLIATGVPLAGDAQAIETDVKEALSRLNCRRR
jgi:hypothetical protein